MDGKNNVETSNQARRRYGRNGGSRRKVITTHPDPLREVQALAETFRACPILETPVHINSPPQSACYEQIAQSPGIPHVFGQTTIDGADIPNPNLLMLPNEDKMWGVVEEQNEEMFCLGMEEAEPQFEIDQFMLPEMQSVIQFLEEAPVGNIPNFDNLH